MSLLVRLLTTGKSLVDLRDTSSRYRMLPKNLLPKFGSTKNPFAARKEAPIGQASFDAVVAAAPEKRKMTAVETAAAGLKETQRLPTLTAAAAGASAPSPALPVRTAPPAVAGMRQWMRKANPLAWWSARRAKTKPAIPSFSRPAVQGELSLDNVKVVRNDLSDADVEIVPAKPAVIPAVAPAAPPPAAREGKGELAEIQTN